LDKPTVKELSQFDLKTYLNFIKYLRQFYRIVPFCQIPADDVPYLILRHDVDIDPIAALKMAKAEHDLGIKATYFILLSSENYNSFDGRNTAIIKQISELGHEIGLHYDTKKYKIYNKDYVRALKNEVKTLESIVGKPVLVISSHAPKNPGIIELKELISADNRQLTDIYVHDSQRIWTIKSLLYLLNSPPQRVQLLIHPVLWGKYTKRQTRLNLLLIDLVLLLNRLRTVAIRILHSNESCDN
jgi:peptidoglycan/xylan/chitin deacetylase (PgdA/CDA1 family)